MKIRFLREFGGRETQEIHYPEGHEMDTGYPVTDSVALDLFGRGIITIETSTGATLEVLQGDSLANTENAPEPTKRARKGKE